MQHTAPHPAVYYKYTHLNKVRPLFFMYTDKCLFLIGGPTWTRTRDQRIMRAFTAVKMYNNPAWPVSQHENNFFIY